MQVFSTISVPWIRSLKSMVAISAGMPGIATGPTWTNPLIAASRPGHKPARSGRRHSCTGSRRHRPTIRRHGRRRSARSISPSGRPDGAWPAPAWISLFSGLFPALSAMRAAISLRASRSSRKPLASAPARNAPRHAARNRPRRLQRRDRPGIVDRQDGEAAGDIVARQRRIVLEMADQMFGRIDRRAGKGREAGDEKADSHRLTAFPLIPLLSPCP
jgi:hypothetical protein